MMSKKSVTILYGFGEGRWHGRKLQSALSAADFTIANNPRDADIIIAHSGGMYGLPEIVANKTVLLVAPSCGQPNKTWLQTQSKKVWQDMIFFSHAGMFAPWLQKSCWNMFYLIKQIPRLPRLWLIHRRHQAGIPTIIAKATTVVIFKDDPWSGYLSAEEKTKHPDYTFITVEATHDDIWLHPEKYVELAYNSNSERI